MGCDLHLHVEIKIKGRWHCYNSPSISRNYQLFAKMAGVRNYEEWNITPISEPRGMPKDSSIVSALDALEWGGDGHSHSYLTAEEIAELDRWVREDMKWSNKGHPWWMDDTFGFLFGNSLAGFSRYPSDRKSFVEDVRFVFWFDN